MTENIYVEKKDIDIEPDSGWWKNIYLRLLARCGYLSIMEGYKITIVILSYSKDLEFLNKEKDFVQFIGLKTSSIIGYKEDRIKDRNVEFFVKFLLPIDNFNLKLGNDKTKIYIDNKDELNVSLKDLSLKFTTLFTPNNVLLMVIVTIISSFISPFIPKILIKFLTIITEFMKIYY